MGAVLRASADLVGPALAAVDLPAGGRCAGLLVRARADRREKSPDRGRGGAGIGLAIVRQLVGDIGSRLDVTRAAGRPSGSRFRHDPEGGRSAAVGGARPARATRRRRRS